MLKNGGEWGRLENSDYFCDMEFELTKETAQIANTNLGVAGREASTEVEVAGREASAEVEVAGREVSAPKRLVWLDAAKFVGLILVAMWHLYHFEYWRFNSIVKFVGLFSLGMFWVASGFMTRTDFSLKRKFLTLMVPYVIMDLLCIAYMSWATPEKVTSKIFLGIFYARMYISEELYPSYHSMMTLINGVLWFLPSLFTGYLLLKVIYQFKRLRTQGLVALAMFGVTFLIPYIPILLPWSLDVAFFAAPLMWLGHVARRFKVFEKFNWKILLISWTFYTLLAISMKIPEFYISEMGEYYPLSFFGIIFGAAGWFELFLLLEYAKINRWLARFSRWQMWIYGLQIPMFHYAMTLPFRSMLWGTLLMAWQLGFAIAGGCLFGWFYDQVTSLRWRRLGSLLRLPV